MIKKKFDLLTLEIYNDRREAGYAAGMAAAAAIRKVLEEKGAARVIFAAAPSQNEMLETLTAAPGIDWRNVTAFHMDEYLGLAEDDPRRFSWYLETHVFGKVPFGEVNRISCPPRLTKMAVRNACVEYAKKLIEAPVDVVCLGVGENGHLAFNDPPAEFSPFTRWVKDVTLDEACRRQQVNDGCFPELDAVPRQAITLTIPALLAGESLICTVPGVRKREAVRRMLFGEISEESPASYLRTHENCVVFVDRECWGEDTKK